MASASSSIASADRDDNVSSGVGAALSEIPIPPDENRITAIPISLQLEARHLPNLDTRGKSDPFLIVYRKGDVHEQEWVRIGQTETVYNSLNPRWTTTFTVEYRFGVTTVLRFRVYDRDNEAEDLSKQDFIGEVRCTVAQVVLADNQRLTLKIENSNPKPAAKAGILVIRGEEKKGDLGDSVTFQFAISGLRRGRKPFYVLSSKNRSDDEFSPVIYSEVHQAYGGSSYQTTFKPITMPLARLTNGDLDRELEVQFMDYDRRGSHYRGGKTRFTLRSAKAAVHSTRAAKFELRKRKSNGQLVDAGTLIMKKCEICAPFSFLDYIRSGVLINTVVAVDMSNTNGNPADPGSLQYRGGQNEYVTALREVGSVLATYDTAKKFPAFGFGAALPPAFNETAHCFALTGKDEEPMCNSMEGVIGMYLTALSKVAPFEPCRYGPVLKHVIKMAREANANCKDVAYTVLLLVTDGDFADFADVANLICDAAELPISIVIVGVGNSRFLKLEKLDGDREHLCSTAGIPCARDIVQFVQFHQHRYKPSQLAREVLDEIPEQLVSYMRSKGIKPTGITPSGGSSNSMIESSISQGPYLPEAVLQTFAAQSSTNSLGNSNPQPLHSTSQTFTMGGVPVACHGHLSQPSILSEHAISRPNHEPHAPPFPRLYPENSSLPSSLSHVAMHSQSQLRPDGATNPHPNIPPTNLHQGSMHHAPIQHPSTYQAHLQQSGHQHAPIAASQSLNGSQHQADLPQAGAHHMGTPISRITQQGGAPQASKPHLGPPKPEAQHTEAPQGGGQLGTLQHTNSYQGEAPGVGVYHGASHYGNPYAAMSQQAQSQQGNPHPLGPQQTGLYSSNQPQGDYHQYNMHPPGPHPQGIYQPSFHQPSLHQTDVYHQGIHQTVRPPPTVPPSSNLHSYYSQPYLTYPLYSSQLSVSHGESYGNQGRPSFEHGLPPPHAPHGQAYASAPPLSHAGSTSYPLTQSHDPGASYSHGGSATPYPGYHGHPMPMPSQTPYTAPSYPPPP